MPEESFLSHAETLHFVSALLKRLLIMSVFSCTYGFLLMMDDLQNVKL